MYKIFLTIICLSVFQVIQSADNEMNDGNKTVSDSWNRTLQKSGFEKSGLNQLNHHHYQYQPLGLGGTTIRVDPWGFAGTNAPYANTGSWHIHRPYLGYEYWWDHEGHRFNPFILKGGYGAKVDRYGFKIEPGAITSFFHRLDVTTGELTIDLDMRADEVSFTTRRTVFVTPDGVLIIRVHDTGAPSPIQLNVSVEQAVRIYNNQGIYAAPHEGWNSHFTTREQAGTKGIVITAARTNTSTAALCVVIEAASPVEISDKTSTINSSGVNDVVTFYIAPTSSFNPDSSGDPGDDAWNKAYAARQKGYETLKQETALWWNDYMNRSKISITDESIAKLYAQSIFYHGVYFGNTTIPPGCNSTDTESFAGAICPEYDLTFSQLALVYTGRLNEAKNIADWTYNVLPKAKENAVKGVAHHNITRKYSDGAIYTTLMGYDGAICLQPMASEQINLLSNYPGANAALMALAYLDYSNDHSFREKAHDILKSTTYVSLQDMTTHGDYYRCRNMPNLVQQSAARMGYNECRNRGLAEPDWNKFDDKILLPETSLHGDILFAGGVGASAVEGVGDATWLSPLWWYGVVDKNDPRVLPSYLNSAKSSTGDYVFNNGTMGVIAAKLGLGNQAVSWLRNFNTPNVYYDDVCFSEVIGNHTLTPEIGAHGAYICNVTQMLIDPDDDRRIDLFPAIPDEWDNKDIGFNDLMVKGGLSVSATRDTNHVEVTVTNRSADVIRRDLRIKIPGMVQVDAINADAFKDGYIIVQPVIHPGETQRFEYSFKKSDIISNTVIEANKDDERRVIIFPNPNTTGILFVSDTENVKDIFIYTLSGQLAAKLTGGNSRYPVYNLENGHYIIIIITKDNKSIRQKLIINR